MITAAEKLLYSSFFSYLGKQIKTISTLDLRSLALLRVLIGLLILVDLINRSSDLVAFYTDFGVLPRADLIRSSGEVGSLSVHMMSGAWQFQTLLFLAAAIFAAMLVLGYKTRLATVASWYLLISLQARNPLVLSGADQVFRMVLFFAIFLPWGVRFSLDAWRTKTSRSLANNFASPGTFAYIFQLGSLYVFSALLKTSPEWRSEGTAIYYALSMDDFTTRLGLFMLQFPQILKVQTHLVFWFEALGPFLLLVPFFRGIILTLEVFLFISLHIGIGTNLRLGFFPWVCSFAWCALLPAWFWDSLLNGLKINNIVQLLQSSFKKIMIPIFRLKYLDRASDHIKNRLLNTSYQLMTDLRFYRSGIVLGITIFATIYIFCWNLGTLPNNPKIVPKQLGWIAGTFAFYQRWDMFAPAPGKLSGWFVVQAILKNGTDVDIYSGRKEVSLARPELISETYKNANWQKYLTNITQKGYEKNIVYYSNYLCRKWNSSHFEEEQIDRLTIINMRQLTVPNGHNPARKIIIGEKKC